MTHPTAHLPLPTYAECTQPCTNTCEQLRTLADAKWRLTCVDTGVHRSRWLRGAIVRPAHNPEVAGSNPVPATNVSAGQRPFCSSEREGLWRCGQRMVNVPRPRTGADVGGHRRISRGSWRARRGADHGRERHSRRFRAVLFSKVASAGIPDHSD